MYYVYELIDPRNNLIFYIGKGKHKRMYIHYNNVFNNKHINNGYLENKLKQLVNAGLKPIYNKIFESENEQDCFDKEIERIAEIGLNNLCNLTLGGEGGSVYGRKLTNETKEKIRNSNIGKKRTDETKENIRQARIKQFKEGEHPMSGRKHSEESRKKMSESKKGEKNNNYGKSFSKEHKEKISNSKIGSNNPSKRKDVREKISKSMTGKKRPGSGKKAWETRRKNGNDKFSDEHKMKLSLAAKNRKK